MVDQPEDADRTRKERSPSFPFISLPRAVERLREMSDGHKKNQARLPVVGATWNYGPKSSGLLQTVAALKAFGLIDDIASGPDRKIQITDLGWRILHDTRPGAKDTAIREAALKPRLIFEYAEKWLPERPSDPHCLSELQLDRGFNEAAANNFLRVFDKTAAFASLQRADISGSSLEIDAEEAPQGPQDGGFGTAAAGAHPLRTVRASQTSLEAGEPFKLEIFGRHIDLVARLETPEQVDELIRRLQFGKLMITPVDSVKKPDGKKFDEGDAS